MEFEEHEFFTDRISKVALMNNDAGKNRERKYGGGNDPVGRAGIPPEQLFASVPAIKAPTTKGTRMKVMV